MSLLLSETSFLKKSAEILHTRDRTCIKTKILLEIADGKTWIHGPNLSLIVLKSHGFRSV